MDGGVLAGRSLVSPRFRVVRRGVEGCEDWLRQDFDGHVTKFIVFDLCCEAEVGRMCLGLVNRCTDVKSVAS